MKIYTDGSGNGKIAFMVEDNDGQKIITETENLGDCTNNVAEYVAVLKALKHITSNIIIKDKNVEVVSDSKLVVSQLRHEWHIKDDQLRDLAKAVWNVAQRNQLRITYTWVRRKDNPAGKLLG